MTINIQKYFDAVIVKWEKCNGLAKASDNNIYELKIDQYMPHSAFFSSPTVGMRIEIAFNIDKEGEKIISSFSKIPHIGFFDYARSMKKAYGNRFFLGKKQVVLFNYIFVYLFYALFAGLILSLLFGINILVSLPFVLPIILISIGFGIFSKHWIWTDTETYFLTSQMNVGFLTDPDFALWRDLQSVSCIRSRLLKLYYVKLVFNQDNKAKKELYLPLWLMDDGDQYETLAILRRHCESYNVQWNE